jgi:hypothetical protein
MNAEAAVNVDALLEAGLMRRQGIINRRRIWRPEEKTTLLAEVEAKGGRVSLRA